MLRYIVREAGKSSAKLATVQSCWTPGPVAISVAWHASWNGKAAALGNFLKVTDSGGNTTLSIAPTGSGASTASPP